MSKSDLSVDLCGFKLRNPVMLASGILGATGPMLKRVVNAGVGAVVSKSIGPVERVGYPNPTIVEPMENVVLNAMGFPNPGYKEFANEIPIAKEGGVPVIISIFGNDSEEFVEVAIGMEKAGADMLEIDISCPHPKKRTEMKLIGQDLELTSEILSSVRKAVKIPIIVKLSPNVTDIRKFVRISVSQECDVDAICAINTIQALEIDPIFERPVLGNLVGGQSGPSIRCIALRKVADIVLCLEKMKRTGELEKEVPVIGVGGIKDGLDVARFILAGATCVQIGSAVLYEDLAVFPKTIKELEEYMKRKDYQTLSDFRGKALMWLKHVSHSDS